MKRLIEEKKINPSIDALQKISQSFAQIASSRKSIAASIADLPEIIYSLLKSNGIQLERFGLMFSELFSQLEFIHREFSSVELNVSSDYNLLCNRFEGVSQLNDAYVKIKDDYAALSHKVIEVKANDLYEKEFPSYNKKKAGLEKAIQTAIDRKKAKVQEYKNLLDELIKTKTAYNQFKTETLKQIWTNYTAAFKHFSEEEVRIYQSILKTLEELKQEGNAPVARIIRTATTKIIVKSDLLKEEAVQLNSTPPSVKPASTFDQGVFEEEEQKKEIVPEKEAE